MKVDVSLVIILLIFTAISITANFYFGLEHNKSNDLRVKVANSLSDLNMSIQVALLEYSDEHDRYPDSLQELIDTGYLAQMPICPYTNQGFREIGDMDRIATGTVFYKKLEEGYCQVAIYGLVEKGNSFELKGIMKASNDTSE